MSDFKDQVLKQYEKYKGVLEVALKVPFKDMGDLTTFYTPGVAEPCKEIARDPSLVNKYTGKGNMVAVITDGSAVLGLGNIGALAGRPVMEGKCAIFKAFGGVDAIPICLDTQDTEEMIAAIKAIAPSFGGINLEDISAPRCFEIEKRLNEELDIPVFHDDQHGTAIVCLAGLINALKVVGKEPGAVRTVVSGAGAAGIAITKLLKSYGFGEIILQDSKGLIYEGREGLNWAKEEIAKVTNSEKLAGGLEVALKGADIFIGVSQPGIVSEEMAASMADGSIVFAMSNPVPEIMPDVAKAAGVAVMATGRSDFPNQVNNSLVFPGIFRGALDAGAGEINEAMKIAAAEGLARLVQSPSAERVVPGVFDEGVSESVAKAVRESV